MTEPSSAEAVFCESLGMEPAERAAFLDRACAGNEPLRREVQSLLDAYQKVGPFLERPLVETEGLADLAAAEAADALGVSVATAERWWAFARAWLYRELHGGGEAGE